MSPLAAIRAALQDVPLGALRALQSASGQTAGVAPGLFAWLEHATGWEIDRRNGFEYGLRPPDDAIDPSEAPDALLAATALLATFRQTGSCAPVEQLLTATMLAIQSHDPRH